MAVRVRKLELSDERARFTCGDPDLDSFFRKYAAKNQFEFFVGATYVAVDEEHGSPILGFVTVSPGTVSKEENVRLRDAVGGKKAPRYPLPILRIARLGVLFDMQKRGLGGILLGAALDLAVAMSREVGCSAVVVDAYASADKFYGRYGFKPFEGQDIVTGESNTPGQTTMFLPMNEIIAAQAS